MLECTLLSGALFSRGLFYFEGLFPSGIFPVEIVNPIQLFAHIKKIDQEY